VCVCEGGYWAMSGPMWRGGGGPSWRGSGQQWSAGRR